LVASTGSATGNRKATGTRLDTGDKLVTELVEVTEIRVKRRFDPFISWSLSLSK